MTRAVPDSAREELVAAYLRLHRQRLVSGSAGNLSLRWGDHMLITPTGIPPDRLAAGDTVAMTLAGGTLPGQLRPSSEWLLHAALYRARPELAAVVRCHSRYATTLACAHRSIPPLHYMIAVTGGDEIPLAPYATFGSEALAQAALEAMGRGLACLLANHGQVACGETLAQALQVAGQVEELACLYWGSLAIGGPARLSPAAMAEVAEAFAGYGQQPGPGADDVA